MLAVRGIAVRGWLFVAIGSTGVEDDVAAVDAEFGSASAAKFSNYFTI